MKKRLAAAGVGLGLIAILSGCSERDIMYNGKMQPESVVEEIIADQIEVENPELDLEVSISDEED